MKRTPEELRQLIDKETEKIKTLEASYPELVEGKGLYDSANTPYHIHHTEVRDAYWRRRMFTSELNDGDLAATAQVY
jgi:hypothetical protein